MESWLIIGVAIVAMAYSLVGHGGASGYLALLAFTTISPKVGSTTALILNVFVAGVTFLTFRRAQHFDWRLTWPFLIGSIPFAFLGGRLKIDNQIQNWMLAATLLYAAVVLAVQIKPLEPETKPPKVPQCIAVGAGVGLLSGIIGVGGGIFLSPLLILLNWGKPHPVAATSAVFIFLNSLSGLAARSADLLHQSLAHWPLIVAGLCGALLGSSLGANRVSGLGLRRALGVVLLLAVWKLITK